MKTAMYLLLLLVAAASAVERQFSVIDKMVSFYEAQNLCRSKGAQLAMVKPGPNNDETPEWKLLTRYLAFRFDSLTAGGKQWFWLGGRSSADSKSRLLRLFGDVRGNRQAKVYADITTKLPRGYMALPICEIKV